MKTFMTGAVAAALSTISTVAMAGISTIPTDSAADSGNDNGVLIVLAVIGALMLINGAAGSGRAKTETTEDDSDVLMKF